MRGSGWATDWPKAVRGLHELAHAAAGPLRKGGGLNFLPVQEDQEIERNAAIKCGQNRDGRRDCRGLVAPSASRCAVPLRLAALACVGQRSEKHTPIGVRWREDLGMRERQEITFRAHKREHIRVASSELPWVGEWFGTSTLKGLDRLARSCRSIPHRLRQGVENGPDGTAMQPLQ